MKIFCIGRNYVDHIHELKNEIPESMVIFMKPASSLHDISKSWSLPNFSKDIHYECELVLKISKQGKNIPLEEAFNYYEELSLGIDFTARDIQSNLKAKGLPWEKAKAFDGSALLGHFVAKTKFDLKNLSFSLIKNGMMVQHGNTKQMIHSFSSIISELSRYFTLETSDLIFTGTPAGVGPIQSGDAFIGKMEDLEIFHFDVK
ncbi:MAG: fumarylacetoacetate hydrolase family protein [Chitinophagales bacterium]|nr:fumarylacetoacetate hydrolase family protein [Chitinophagales bacterium]